MRGVDALIRIVSAGALALAIVPVQAMPRIPLDDSVVLEHVPAASETAHLDIYRQKLLAHPNDLASVIALARGYIDIGRSTADPRFISYAQATLAPWVERARPSVEVLVLQATTLQNLHRFEPSLVLLDRALALEPRNAQALLTRATVLQVQGRFDAARETCRGLIEAAGQLVAVACLTGVNSLTGRLRDSYDALNSVFRDDARLPVSLRKWILGLLAEMSVREGRQERAEDHFRAALRVAPDDIYLKADYADLLLDQKRDREVIALLEQNEQQDNLLLRLAIAGHRVQSDPGRRWAQLFEARYQAARRDGDFTHLREQARFALEVRGDVRDALTLASRNWQVQREPADVRVYAQAAVRAQDSSAIQALTDWMRHIRYEDATLGAASAEHLRARFQ